MKRPLKKKQKERKKKERKTEKQRSRERTHFDNDLSFHLLLHQIILQDFGKIIYPADAFKLEFVKNEYKPR